MAVRPSTEGVVTLVMRFVHGSLLGAQEQRIDLWGKRRARRILNRRVNSAGVSEHDARSEPALHGPELRERFGRRGQAVGRGVLMNAIGGNQIAIGQELGHAFVGEQHGLLDQARRSRALSCDDIDGHARLIEQDMNLRRVEVDRAPLAADLTACTGQCIGVAKECAQVHAVGASGFHGELGASTCRGVECGAIRLALPQQRVGRTVIHAHARANHARIGLVRPHATLGVELDVDREGKTVLIGPQRA